MIIASQKLVGLDFPLNQICLFHCFVAMSVKKNGQDPAENVLQPSETAEGLEVSQADGLGALMKFYESNPPLEEEESEVDLMVQLSGMAYPITYNDD